MTNIPTPSMPSTSIITTMTDTNSALVNYFVQTVISTAVPTIVIVTILTCAMLLFKATRDNTDEDDDDFDDYENEELYSDLYLNTPTSTSTMSKSPPWKSILQRLFTTNKSSSPPLSSRTMIPDKQYITMEHLNRKYDSYQYSISAATNNKAMAATTYRQQQLPRVWSKALLPIDTSTRNALLDEETEFGIHTTNIMTQIHDIQQTLTLSALDNYNTTTNTNTHNRENKQNKALLSSLMKLQQELFQRQLDFRTKLLELVGPEDAPRLKAIWATDTALSFDKRPLDAIRPTSPRTPSLFVTRFQGDVQASQVSNLREEVTAILTAAQPGDEALLILETGGGTVTGYGLAAGQLTRFRDHNMTLTVCVEQVAASGGYMMCCVADHIIASPFAVLGSIGVISDIPNVYKRLKDEGIEFQTVTAGKYKRTLTPTKQVTQEDVEKSQMEIEEILVLFKAFIHQNRPSLDIDAVATGETWFGSDAVARGLCDEIRAVDDVLMDYIKTKEYNVYQVTYAPPEESALVGLFNGGKKSSQMESTIQWLVKMVAKEIKTELGGNIDVQQRYMLKDDRRDRYRM